MRFINPDRSSSLQLCISNPTNMVKDELTEGKVPEKQKKAGRSAETMFRVSLNNHQRLSDMADNKAHIMITVNSIILSAVLTILVRRLNDNDYLVIPAFLLVSTALIAIILAILATRPKLSNGRFDRDALEHGKVNLLFFGNFHQMPYEQYRDAMEVILHDKAKVYESLIMDGYALGVILGKKYKLIRLCYTVFMIGLLLSVMAFFTATIIHAF